MTAIVKSLWKRMVVKKKGTETQLYIVSCCIDPPKLKSQGDSMREQRTKVLCPIGRFLKNLVATTYFLGSALKRLFPWECQVIDSRELRRHEHLYKQLRYGKGPSKVLSAQSPPSFTILPMQKSILSQGLPEISSKANNDGI